MNDIINLQTFGSVFVTLLVILLAGWGDGVRALFRRARRSRLAGAAPGAGAGAAPGAGWP